jgi:hypothetical protein
MDHEENFTGLRALKKGTNQHKNISIVYIFLNAVSNDTKWLVNDDLRSRIGDIFLSEYTDRNQFLVRSSRS